jgi:hypothetical protein
MGLRQTHKQKFNVKGIHKNHERRWLVQIGCQNGARINHEQPNSQNTPQNNPIHKIHHNQT